MALAVGLAYAVLVAVAAAQAATGRADLDAPVTFAAAGLVCLLVARARVPTRAVLVGLAAVGAVLSAWALVAFGVALTRHLGDPASFYAVKVAVTTPVAAHNVLASLLLVGLVAGCLLVGGDRRWWAAVVLLTLALGATLSRGAVLVGLLLPVGAAVLRDRRLAVRLAATTVTALVLVLAAAGLLDASVPDPGGPTSVASRGQLWAAGWDAFASSPLTGVGLDGFRDHAAAFGAADPRDHAHDLFLHAAATGGVAVLLAVTVLWGSLAVAGRRLRDPVTRALVLLGGGVLFAHALVEETAFRPAVEVVLALLLALALTRAPAPSAHPTARSESHI